MTSLWLIGDSFSAPHHRSSPAWYDHLGITVENHSLQGACQDWIARRLYDLRHEIMPGDHVIICWTHPNRFWYSLDQPHITNHHIREMRSALGRDLAAAAESYRRYLQRPDLDLQWQTQRLAWISLMLGELDLASLMILQCFPGERGPEIPGITWAQGDLFTVSQREFVSSDPQADRIFEGIDPRYNHLSLRNHWILEQKIRDWFDRGEPVDLSQGFHQRFLDHDLLSDPDYRLELDPERLER